MLTFFVNSITRIKGRKQIDCFPGPQVHFMDTVVDFGYLVDIIAFSISLRLAAFPPQRRGSGRPSSTLTEWRRGWRKGGVGQKALYLRGRIKLASFEINRGFKPLLAYSISLRFAAFPRMLPEPTAKASHWESLLRSDRVQKKLEDGWSWINYTSEAGYSWPADRYFKRGYV